ncbi:MAG: ImmA/IrrE family metallo-endopeptidase [Pyrinomonadaceae bacterium]
MIDRISATGIPWNRRPLAETDFYAVCKRHKIAVQEMPLSIGGFYYRVAGRDFIAIDSKLTGPERLLVMFHELGHCLFHTPDTGATASFHRVGRRTRKECEADVFALCSLIPRAWLESRSRHELLDHEGLPAGIVNDRLSIYQRHAI